MQAALFIFSLIIIGVYAVPLPRFVSKNSGSGLMYGLVTQLAFSAPVIVQVISFFVDNVVWQITSNLIVSLSLFVLLHCQNGFGISQWRSRRNQTLIGALLAGCFLLSSIFSIPPYLYSFGVILLISFLIHFRDLRHIKTQATSLESVQSKLRSLDSERSNRKFQYQHEEEKIRKI